MYYYHKPKRDMVINVDECAQRVRSLKRLDDVGGFSESSFWGLLLVCSHYDLQWEQWWLKRERKLFTKSWYDACDSDTKVCLFLERHQQHFDFLLQNMTQCTNRDLAMYYRRYPKDCSNPPELIFMAPFACLDAFDVDVHRLFDIDNGMIRLTYRDLGHIIWSHTEQHVRHFTTHCNIPRDVIPKPLEPLLERRSSIIWAIHKHFPHVFEKKKLRSTGVDCPAQERELTDLEDMAKHRFPPCMALLVHSNHHPRFEGRRAFTTFCAAIGLSREDTSAAMFELYTNDKSVNTIEQMHKVTNGVIDAMHSWVVKEGKRAIGCRSMKERGLCPMGTEQTSDFNEWYKACDSTKIASCENCGSLIERARYPIARPHKFFELCQ